MKGMYRQLQIKKKLYFYRICIIPYLHLYNVYVSKVRFIPAYLTVLKKYFNINGWPLFVVVSDFTTFCTFYLECNKKIHMMSDVYNVQCIFLWNTCDIKK